MNKSLFVIWLTFFTNHIRLLVGFNECGLEESYYLEEFWTCTFMALLFALWNWGEQLSWHHMYRLSSSSSASIRAWDQLHGETLAGKSAHGKVKWTNMVGSFRIDKYKCWQNSIGHSEDTRQSWNYTWKIAQENHIRQFGRTYIAFVDRHNTLNWQQRTS